MKNTLIIAITKTYEFRTHATDVGLAFDEYLNTTPRKLKYLDAVVEPTEFKIWTPKKRKPYKKYQHNTKEIPDVDT